MIVADTNVIAYLFLPTEFTAHSGKLLEMHPEWASPSLWRSEFRNVLALYMRKRSLTFEQAYAMQREAEDLLAGNEYEMPPYDVLKLASQSGCSAYDCEYVALARQLDVKLVTMDKGILKAFPDSAVSLVDIVRS